MATETMRDYLVALGFKVDETGLKKFTGGVNGAAKAVTGLVAAVVGASLTVGAAVAAFASNLEALYFAAQRTGASAENLKAFEKAAQNMGAGAGEALQSVEGLARWMRNTPGSEGFLQSLGVQTRDANGALRDTVDITADLGDKLAAMPQYLANQYGRMAGISENTLLAMRNGGFRQALDEQKRLLSDAGYQQATKDAHEFEVKLRALQTRIEVVGVKVGSSLIDALGPQMEEAAAWFDRNAENIGRAISGIAKFVIVAGGIITPILGTIADGWKNIYGWVKIVGDGIAKILPPKWLDKIGAGTAWLFDKLGIRSEVDAAMGIGGVKADTAKTPPSAAPVAAPNSAPKTGGTRGMRNNNPGNIEYGKWAVAHGATGTDGRFAIFPTMEAGQDAQRALLSGYLAKGNDTIGKVLNKWAPSSENNTAAYIAAVSKRIGVAPGQKLTAANIPALADAISRHENGPAWDSRNADALLRASQNSDAIRQSAHRGYGRMAAGAGQAAPSQQISQTTTINVTGGDNPAATGRAVAGEQSRVTGEMARNLKSAVS